MTRLALAALATLVFATEAPAALETAEEIEACLTANQPDDSSVQTISMYATDRGGMVTESRAELFWQRFDGGLSKVLMRFSAPPDLRGSSLLMIEKKSGRSTMLMYLPELEKVKRVTSRMISGSMFGTDFSYEDFERLQGFEDDTETTRLDDAQIGGRPHYVLRTSVEDSVYESIVTFIDQDRCVPVKTEFREHGGKLRKVAEMDPGKVTREDGKWIPREIVIRDLLNDTQTRLEVEKIDMSRKIPRKMFSERELARGH